MTTPFTVTTRVTRSNLHIREQGEFSKDICLVLFCFVSLIFTRVKLIHNVMLASGVQQSESVVHMHMCACVLSSFSRV